MSYLKAVADFYADVARDPAVGLCCVGGADRNLPGLRVPTAMEEMSYGCGSSAHPIDLAGEPSVVYVGVGGAKEASAVCVLQPQAWWCHRRRTGCCITGGELDVRELLTRTIRPLRIPTDAMLRFAAGSVGARTGRVSCA